MRLEYAQILLNIKPMKGLLSKDTVVSGRWKTETREFGVKQAALRSAL